MSAGERPASATRSSLRLTREALTRALAAWAILTAVACIVVCSATRIDDAPMPGHAAQRWALDALEAARTRSPRPAPPPGASDFRADGPIFAFAWWRGHIVGRHVGPPSLVRAVDEAAGAFATDRSVTAIEGWRAPHGADQRVRFTLSVARGEGPIVRGIPLVEALGLVPLRDGLHVHVDGRDAWATPDELHASGVYDRGIPTPLPEITFGVDLPPLVDRLARETGVEVADVDARGSVRRFRATTIGEKEYPHRVAPTEDALRQAAIDGARFLLRHQRADGTFVYIYDASTGGQRAEPYNLPRHSGSAYVLAEVARLANVREARAGARSALEWVRRTRLRHCGGPELLCVEMMGRVELGSTALTALAAAEYLRGGDDPLVREMLVGLTAHMRAMQRDDGEMMHEYDLQHDWPIDVQYLYYSGEAAFALLAAHAALGDERDLEAARRVMVHLTGASWDFFGSRYYYGEEHWTCIAASAGWDRIESPAALDFCQRWAAFNREVQFRPGDTPWASDGAYGVGPLLLPRTTPVASRSEAFVSTYEMEERAGIRDDALRAQIERGLAMILRWRWAPGPTHLFADPRGAYGGIPGSPTERIVRNDYIQHAASAMLRWSEVLRREREGTHTE